MTARATAKEESKIKSRFPSGMTTKKSESNDNDNCNCEMGRFSTGRRAVRLFVAPVVMTQFLSGLYR
jgi:hypothetical protein